MTALVNSLKQRAHQTKKGRQSLYLYVGVNFDLLAFLCKFHTISFISAQITWRKSLGEYHSGFAVRKLTSLSTSGISICMSRTYQLWLVNKFSFGNTCVTLKIKLLSIKRFDAWYKSQVQRCRFATVVVKPSINYSDLPLFLVRGRSGYDINWRHNDYILIIKFRYSS